VRRFNTTATTMNALPPLSPATSPAIPATIAAYLLSPPLSGAMVVSVLLLIRSQRLVPVARIGLTADPK
jgi:hypothetical protein